MAHLALDSTPRRPMLPLYCEPSLDYEKSPFEDLDEADARKQLLELESYSALSTGVSRSLGFLGALAYLAGPFSALLCLIFAGSHQYVRYHTYQSGLISIPLLWLRLVVLRLQCSPGLMAATNTVIVVSHVCLAIRAYCDAPLSWERRLNLPVVGAMAREWSMEE